MEIKIQKFLAKLKFGEKHKPVPIKRKVGMTISSGKIPLPLLALAGIALVKFALSRIKDRHSKEEVDRISQLPDDVLSSIISRLTMREAIRTSILSRRWQNVPALMSHLSLKCSEMLQNQDCKSYHSNNKKNNEKIFVEGVDALLSRRYSTYSTGAKIKIFQLSCCFMNFCPGEFKKWLSCVGKLGVERLYLDFMCCFLRTYNINKEMFTFSCQLLSEATLLECLLLRGCYLKSYFNNIGFNSLKILHLEYALVEPGVVESILSSCLNLEKLKLNRCVLPSKLWIRGLSEVEELKLKHLIIDACKTLEEIEVHAVNLSVFEVIFFSRTIVKISCAWTPKLEKVCLNLEGIGGQADVFDELAKMFGDVEALLIQSSLFFKGQIPQYLNMYSNLKKVTLAYSETLTCDIFGLAAILEACPYLQTFECMYFRSKYEGRGVEKSVKCHSELKEVHFWGFSGNENEIKFALYILKSALVLERMCMHNSERFYEGDGFWGKTVVAPMSYEKYETVHKRLVGQAVSKSAELILCS